MRGGRPAWWVLATVVAAGSSASAHRLDECLQAARIAIEPGAITLEIDLTPGVDVAGTMVSDVDRDRDGVLSPLEQQAFVTRVFAAAEIAVDGRPGTVSPLPATFPDVPAMLRGEGTIQLRATIPLQPQSAGSHEVFFRNGYQAVTSAYLANALVPESDRVAIRSQRRDAQQRDLTIDYELRSDGPPQWTWLFGGLAVAAAVAGLKKKIPSDIAAQNSGS